LEDLDGQIKRVVEKLQLLIKQRDLLLKENNRLKEELQHLQDTHTQHTGQLENLQQQVEILKARKGEMSAEEKALLEKRLGQYIREIDRCIAMLSE
jgi:hypothetical protein